MFKEFKEFISKGNVIDLAVGVIIGAAFGAIVSSLVKDIITPLLGLIVGGVDFTSLKWVLRENADPTKSVILTYGIFIQAIFNFLIIAFAIFVVIKLVNRFRRQKEEEPAAPPKPSDEILLLQEIRDLLKEKR